MVIPKRHFAEDLWVMLRAASTFSSWFQNDKQWAVSPQIAPSPEVLAKEVLARKFTNKSRRVTINQTRECTNQTSRRHRPQFALL
jgi:hypothetical protein